MKVAHMPKMTHGARRCLLYTSGVINTGKSKTSENYNDMGKNVELELSLIHI